MIARNITCISPNGIGAKEPHFSELKKEKLVSILDDLTIGDLIAAHNHYCEENGYYDDEIHQMDLLPEYLCDIDAMRLLWMVEGNDFRTNHQWFKMDYDNLYSYEDWKAKEEIDISSLANWILREEDDCDVREISDFLTFGLGA